MTVSRTSSLSSTDDGADAGVGGAGDLDLGDFTRLTPLLLASTISLFATRILALRGADTNTRRVRGSSHGRTGTRSPKQGRTVNDLLLDPYIIGLVDPLSLVRVTLFYSRCARLALLR